MSESEEKLVEAYSHLLEGMSAKGKISLIENLARSLKRQETDKDASFSKAFGAFASEKKPEEIIKEIKAARKFTNKDIQI
ncbi:MAG: hypothetical protein ACLFT3_15900 [Cyclobacteriaceae bacterium]